VVVVIGLLALTVLLWPSGSATSWLARAPARDDVATAKTPTPATLTTSAATVAAGTTIAAAADAVLLLALALRSGRGMVDCLDLAAEVEQGRAGADLAVVAAAVRWGVEDHRAWELVGPDWQPAAVAWQAASRAGIAPSEILIEASARMRERAEELTAVKVQRSAVLLVLPLGGLFLPGFVATTVVPIVLHLIHRFGT
jgi:Flp pilus assembly protein TadB